MKVIERIRRIFRSFFGLFVSMAEDPKLILQQNIRDMRDKVPMMNTGIAKARGGVEHLAQEIEFYKSDVAKITSRVKACLLNNNEALAGQYASQLQKQKEALERSQHQYESAKAGYDALQKLKERYMHEMQAKTDEAMQAIRESESSQWKGELANVFETFEVADVSSTHQEMLDKLKAKTAEADGKILAAVEGVDMKQFDMEEQAQALEGQELLKQFKMDLGMDKSSPLGSESVKKTIAEVGALKA